MAAEQERPSAPSDAPARQGDYRQARIGAAIALILAAAFLATIDPFIPDYETSPLVLGILLTAGLSLLGVEALGLVVGRK